MSERELNRIEVLSQVTQGRMTAVTAANVLGLSRRQVHRLLKSFQTEGPAAIRHKARGRRSNRHLSYDARVLLDDLFSAPDNQNRYRLTLLKKLSQSTSPSRIKEAVADFQVLSELHDQLDAVLSKLDLGTAGMFISVPPHVALSKVMPRIKGRSSRRAQMEFPELRKRYWGRRFWAHGYFSTTSGNVTDDVILQYLELHSKRDATGVSR